MEQQLKQRLVGATVIFSLAVIFLPMLLDGSGNRPKHLKISIPLPPEIPSYEIVDETAIQAKIEVDDMPQYEPTIVDQISDPVVIKKPEDKKNAEKLIQRTVQPVVAKVGKQDKPAEIKPEPVKLKPKLTAQVTKKTTNKTVKEAAKKPAKKQTGGASWVIQVGSFSDKDKAYQQRDKLRKSKLSSVFIEKFKHDGTLSYRVRMGPFISRDKARIIGNKVRAKYNIKGLVMGYGK